MNWFNTIYECYILLKKVLEKEGIKCLDILMNIIFKELFNKLHDQECINKYTKLIEFEKELDSLIQEKVDKAKDIIEKFNEIEKENFKDKTSAIVLLKEMCVIRMITIKMNFHIMNIFIILIIQMKIISQIC
jgi:hypothetical protein